MNNLNNLRQEIDNIDKEIIMLFEKRMERVEEIRKYKLFHNIAIKNETRENEILKKSYGLLKDKNLKPYLEEFLKSMMKISKDYQKDFKEI